MRGVGVTPSASGEGVPYKPHGYVEGVSHYCNDLSCVARVPGDYHVRPNGTIYWRGNDE